MVILNNRENILKILRKLLMNFGEISDKRYMKGYMDAWQDLIDLIEERGDKKLQKTKKRDILLK